MADLVIDDTIEAIVLPNGEELELGKTPTGNIDITQAGVTDVSEYATATVPQGEIKTYTHPGQYYTESNARKWRIRSWAGIEEADLDGHRGWIDDNTWIYSDYRAYNAIPTGTHITPSNSAQTIGAANTMLEGAVTVDAVPSASFTPYEDFWYDTANGQRRWNYEWFPMVTQEGWASTVQGSDGTFNAVPANTTVTPTESAQTIGGANYMMEGAVTVNAIPSNYVGSGITRRDSTDLSASGATVSVPSGYYASNASKSVASGTAGTPTATKSAVSNHAVTVTPSVTNSTGYITGSTKTGTAVTVTASELVSGSETKTINGTYDVTNLAEIVVDVSGGGGSTIQVGTKTATLSAAASSIQFTGLSGNPTSFVVTSSADVSTGGTMAAAVAYDGTSVFGMDVTSQAEADTGYSKSYSSGTLTITATTASFQANTYKLVYTYGGSSADIHTADVQVGSGATSITFSSLSGRPLYWSCIFKSTFGTSSGYQRVIAVANDSSSTYGLAFDSSANALSAWSASYSGGALTISSSGTNNGGYFHQPGYYQLTYAVDDSAPSYQTKSAYATTSAQTITPDTGYDALESVSIGAVSQTNLTAANIKSGTTISISNGQSNLWSVTGTYEGGGGGSLTVATKTLTNTAVAQTLSFTSLSGQPKYWFLRVTSQVSSSGSTTYYYITDLFYNGTGITGNTFRIGSTRRIYNITSGISQSYSNGTLTITGGSSSGATPGQFYGASGIGYELIYIY